MMEKKSAYLDHNEAAQFNQDASLVIGQCSADAHQDSTEWRGLSSKHGRDREHWGGRDRPNEDRQAQYGDVIDPKGRPGSRAALKKGSNFLEPELREKEYGSAAEQHGRTEVQVVGTQKQIYQLIALKNDQKKIIDDLRSKLQRELANNQSIRESANEMFFAMENKDICFGQLVGQIKAWSVSFAAQKRNGMGIDLSGATTQDPRRVVPGRSDLDQFLQTPKNARLFFRGWAGLAISEMLFRSGQHHGSQAKDVWMDQKIGRSFIQIENEFFRADRNAITFRDLNDWRALTAGLISKLYASSNIGKGMEGHFSDCSRRIMSLIGPWVDLDVRQKLEENFLSILYQAVELSQILRCQRASWSVRHVFNTQTALTTSDEPLYFNEAIMNAMSQIPGLTTSDEPLYFNEAVMNDIDDSDDDACRSRDRKIVEIVVSPGLFKRGNTDGERFEVESCVVKAEVSCFSQPSESLKK